MKTQSQTYCAFTIYFFDENPNRLVPAMQLAQDEGYQTLYFHDEFSCFQEIKKNPPHFFVVYGAQQETKVSQLLAAVKQHVPECHIVMLVPEKTYEAATELLAKGLHAVFSFPLQNHRMFMHSLDQAVRWFKCHYKVEELKEVSQEKERLAKKSTFEQYEHWLSELQAKTSLEPAIGHFLQEMRRHLKRNTADAEVVYFKYMSVFHSLVMAQSSHIERNSQRGSGFELRSENGRLPYDCLREPMELQGLQHAINEIFGCEKYIAQPLTVLGEVLGELVFLNHTDELLTDAYMTSCMQALQLVCQRIILQRRLHTHCVIDEETKVLTREEFRRKVDEEIARARRLSLPVSLVVLSIDNTAHGLTNEPTNERSHLGAGEGRLLLRSLAKLIREHSRLNDIIGRLGQDELALILPHTGLRGASIKAERLRRIIASADFSQVYGGQNLPVRLTVSMGISEYPSQCYDGADLLALADEALYEIKKKSSNLVCIASAPKEFEPDFSVPGLISYGVQPI